MSSLPFLVQCVCSLATCCTEKPGQPIAISTSAKVVQEVGKHIRDFSLVRSLLLPLSMGLDLCVCACVFV